MREGRRRRRGRVLSSQSSCRLLEPAVYARSLVQLAGAAITVGRPTAKITVGIADSDILEECVMAFLNRPKLGLRRKTLLLAAVALVFIVSRIAAAPFALRIGVNSKDDEETPSVAVATPQDVVVTRRQGVTQETRGKEMKMNETDWKKKGSELGALR